MAYLSYFLPCMSDICPHKTVRITIEWKQKAKMFNKTPKTAWLRRNE
jgi:hypothetical protein